MPRKVGFYPDDELKQKLADAITADCEKFKTTPNDLVRVPLDESWYYVVFMEQDPTEAEYSVEEWTGPASGDKYIELTIKLRYPVE